ncbi:interferon-induced very large GTPase 1-like [Dendropsophus ebraccatus]|uniref:interferon-induced very large GTPase 1-like n=1 Tax=Dendropsophus ebraccatus TaxID=150705 RepID=UPI00383209DE
MSGKHNQPNQRIADIQLKSKLDENGLDPDYWLKEIRGLGIRNIHDLKHVQADDYSRLENKIRYPWEKIALRELFDIPETNVKSEKVQKKQDQLKVLKTEKKILQDEVFRNEEKKQKLLETSTEGSETPTKTLDLVQYFEEKSSLKVKKSLQKKYYTVESNLGAGSNGSEFPKETQAQNYVDQLSHVKEEQKPSMENSVTVDVSNKEMDFLMLLKDLDLKNFYPKKMKTGDFHTISRTTLSGAKPIENKQLPMSFLHKLQVSDYGARYVYCENKSKDLRSKTRNINHDNTMGTSGNCAQDFFNRNKQGNKRQNTNQAQHIHPMDVQMAIFHCADDFMRQYLYTKLSFCQFALPLLVPDPNTSSIELPLWAFQEVKKKWKTKHGNDPRKSKSNDKFMKDTETPIVSFIRLGPSNFSKSQTINWLMSKHRHDIFYHRHCEGSTKTSVLMDGVTDIAWYCPGGREDDAFDDCTAFVNFHGDARDHGQQLELIQEISSVLVIVLTDSDVDDSKSTSIINQLLRSTKPCIFLLVDEEFSESDNPHKLKIGIKGRNEAELIKEVRTKIQDLILVQNEVYSLNKCAALARRHGFMVDEDEVQCKAGKEQAEKLLKLLKTRDLSARKDTFLPLQGDLWIQWCKKDKELRRLGGRSHLSIEQQRSNIESEKNELRRKQLRKATPLNGFIKDFLYSIKQGSKMYFLQWLKMYLDELSSEVLVGLNKQYHHLWSSVKAEKQGEKKQQLIDKNEKELQKLSSQISLSTFGLEHVLRELGQIYEAFSSNIRDEIIQSLPKIASNLMIWGYPIELMDGDAAHIPVNWIRAILQELKDTLGDKKLFVLSVLGIQSSGKSTLLNAMFGLQFAVSAGRCTRGAFMQLVKVEEDLRKELTYDYVLVVDTEGLRSTELSSQNVLNHDNELATFVIGLGNLALINIFGENPAEMQDILHIAVQAFLRMKKVKLHPSCMFVHQNVGEITAEEKTMEGRRCLQSKLDEMTLCAAKQQECDVTCFNDVIKFDVDSHIHFFSHLWEGDPPMAPPNPRYSQNVQALRKVILDLGKKKDSILSISAFSTRVTDLWNALLSENFVFSFRNSLEIAAYGQLEEKYSQWAWRLRESMLKLQNEINNQIQKEEIKSIDMMWISSRIDEVYSKVQDELTVFFNEDKEKHILVQWRANTENRIAALKHDLIAEIKKKANERIILKEKNRKIDDMKEKYEDEIYTKSRKLALSLKGQNLKSKDLEDRFSTLWNGWISAVIRDRPSFDSLNICKDLDEILLDKFKTEAHILNTIRESYKWKNLTDEFDNFVSGKEGYKFWRSKLSHDVKIQINNSIIVLERRIIEYIAKKEQEKMDYQSSYFHEILRIIREEVSTMFGKKFRFLSGYIVYASLFLCRKAVHRFEKLSEAYRKANDPVVYLESKKEDFYKSLKISYEGTLEVASLADIISTKLQVSLQQAVYEQSAIDMSRAMKCNYPALNGNRSKLEFYLLKSLAEQEKFENYLTYFTDPKSAVRGFIQECIEDYMRDTSNVSGSLHTNVDEYKYIIITAINLSTGKIKKERGNVDSWLDAFCSELGNKLNLSRYDLKSVKYQNTIEIDFLKEAMTQAVDTAVQKLREELSTCDMANIKGRILTILTDNYPGCWEQCPFCGAICTNTVSQHGTDHSLQYHRPDGLKGWRYRVTQELTTDICTSLVSSDKTFYRHPDEDITFPYKSYRDAGEPYSDWSITPDGSSLSYWKWVTCRFQSDIEKHYDRKFEPIPEQWKEISKAEAVSEIEKLITK